MSFDKADIRAWIIFIILAILAYVADMYGYENVFIGLIIIIAILAIMYMNKVYHKVIKKDYFSRYDEIKVPEGTTVDVQDQETMDDESELELEEAEIDKLE